MGSMLFPSSPNNGIHGGTKAKAIIEEFAMKPSVWTPLLLAAVVTHVAADDDGRAASGLRIWVDPDTPADKHSYVSSRGATWELVMSDEFNSPGRSFRPGRDHLWTSLEMPDTVDGGLSFYSHSMVTTVCEEDKTCVLRIGASTKTRNETVYNENSDPPGYQDVTMYYTTGMIQGWNKFCFQGGMVEVRAQLPGALSNTSQNPDLKGDASDRVSNAEYYPTWPGIWMMGNLGRALFSASMERMWPYSYDRCEPDIFDPKNQRISACNEDPGVGLNPSQGRGAPQIDIIKGSGLSLTSSLQISPGMPTDFRRISDQNDTCSYNASCNETGANQVGVPSEVYASRGHKSWYQGLRYGANTLCAPQENATQSYDAVKASLEAGITENSCDLSICPASFDVNSDLTEISGSGSQRWGINTNGTCYSRMNPQMGTLLCSVGNKDPECGESHGTQDSPDFKYYVDTVSANWPIHLAAYTDYLTYQIEWVPGVNGYIRWMLDGQPVYEIPAEAVTNPPQDSSKSNPTKMLPEEPMYLIMNVALSSQQTASPPNAGRACRDKGKPADSETSALNERVCDEFPMYLKVDYVRLYQDVSDASSMSIGCNPSTHPTKVWIDNHIEDYENPGNPWQEVDGLAFCTRSSDCSLSTQVTGICQRGRCKCTDNRGAGPRCTTLIQSSKSPKGDSLQYHLAGFGLALLIAVAAGLYLLQRFAICRFFRRRQPVQHDVIVANENGLRLTEFPRRSSSSAEDRLNRSPSDYEELPPSTPPPAPPRTHFIGHLSPLRTFPARPHSPTQTAL